jgi:hypothetical protein
MTSVPAIQRVLLFTDRGDLLLWRLTAAGHEEVGRFHLLEPTGEYGQQKMAWCRPLTPAGASLPATTRNWSALRWRQGHKAICDLGFL